MQAALRSLAVLLLLATSISAQTLDPPEHTWSRGATLSGFAGAAMATSTDGPLAGGAIGWTITPWIGVEGSGAWLQHGRGASAFSASLAGHANLMRPGLAVPFVRGGIGLYRAWFDRDRGPLPGFYEARLGASASIRPSFTDPAFVLGGGLNLFVASRWAIRPQAEALVVRRHGQSHTLALFTVHVAHHFERPTMRPGRATPWGTP
jgi:hypothetical protein